MNLLNAIKKSCGHIDLLNQGCLDGQEKSGKTKKNNKSQVKMGVFEKSREKSFKTHKILSVQIYKIPYF